MTENQKPEDEIEDDSLTISLGVFRMKLTGKMLQIFLPYAGWALLILSGAYAMAVVYGAVK